MQGPLPWKFSLTFVIGPKEAALRRAIERATPILRKAFGDATIMSIGDEVEDWIESLPIFAEGHRGTRLTHLYRERPDEFRLRSQLDVPLGALPAPASTRVSTLLQKCPCVIVAAVPMSFAHIVMRFRSSCYDGPAALTRLIDVFVEEFGNARAAETIRACKNSDEEKFLKFSQAVFLLDEAVHSSEILDTDKDEWIDESIAERRQVSDIAKFRQSVINGLTSTLRPNVPPKDSRRLLSELLFAFNTIGWKGANDESLDTEERPIAKLLSHLAVHHDPKDTSGLAIPCTALEAAATIARAAEHARHALVGRDVFEWVRQYPTRHNLAWRREPDTVDRYAECIATAVRAFESDLDQRRHLLRFEADRASSLSSRHAAAILRVLPPPLTATSHPSPRERQQGGSPKYEHSSDFSTVVFDGVSYQFTPLQAKCVELLWVEWEKGAHGLMETTIGEKSESRANRFKLRDVYRPKGRAMHPAWGTMIVPIRTGVFGLKPRAPQ